MPFLYRTMIRDNEGWPKLGRSARMLGVRTGNPDGFHDVLAQNPMDVVKRGEGLSTAPDDPRYLVMSRRPIFLGGKSRDPLWSIDVTMIDPPLMVVFDSPNHATITPIRDMMLVDFEAAMALTRTEWMPVQETNDERA